MKTDKLLIIKHGSIGDIFMSLDSVKAISQEYSYITLLSTDSGHKIFEFYKYNFKKICDNRDGIFKSFKIIKLIIEQNFDIVVDLQNSQRTSIYFLILKIFTKSILNSTSIFASKRYLKNNFDELVSLSLKKQIKVIGIFGNEKFHNKLQRSIQRKIILVPGSSKVGRKKDGI